VIVTDGIVSTEREENTRGLFAEDTDVVNEIVGNEALSRVLIARGIPGPPVFSLAEGTTVFTVGIQMTLSHQTDCALTGFSKFIAVDFYTAIMVIQKDGVSSDGIKKAALNVNIFAPFQIHRSASIDTPISH